MSQISIKITVSALFVSRVDIDKELEKVDEDGKPKGRCFVDGKEVKDIPEYVDTKGNFSLIMLDLRFYV